MSETGQKPLLQKLELLPPRLDVVDSIDDEADVLDTSRLCPYGQQSRKPVREEGAGFAVSVAASLQSLGMSS